MKCSNPGSRFCNCLACSEDQISVSGLRNLELYNNSKNPLARWMNSPAWTKIPGFMNVRGECITKYLKPTMFQKEHTRNAIVKIVANGAVSGEIAWK